jgi:hypothetical protein
MMGFSSSAKEEEGVEEEKDEESLNAERAEELDEEQDEVLCPACFPLLIHHTGHCKQRGRA